MITISSMRGVRMGVSCAPCCLDFLWIEIVQQSVERKASESLKVVTGTSNLWFVRHIDLDLTHMREVLGESALKITIDWWRTAGNEKSKVLRIVWQLWAIQTGACTPYASHQRWAAGIIWWLRKQKCKGRFRTLYLCLFACFMMRLYREVEIDSKTKERNFLSALFELAFAFVQRLNRWMTTT